MNRAASAGRRQLEEEFATLQSRSAKETAPASKTSRSNKAAAVEAQCKLWNSALGIRITLQRSLVAADRLPRGHAHACVLQNVPEAPEALSAARKAAIGAIGECMHSMHDILSRVAPGAGTASEEGTPSAMLDTEALAGASAGAWPQLEKLESRFSAFRDNEVDRGHRKTMLATGQTALKGVGGLQALNKPLSQQVDDVLRAPERALQKARRQRQEHDRVLCEGQSQGGTDARVAVHSSGGDQEPAGELSGADRRFALSKAASAGAGEAQEGWKLRRATVAGQFTDVAGDVESFDDSAFYQVLLQEFLESAQVQGLLDASLKVRVW